MALLTGNDWNQFCEAQRYGRCRIQWGSNADGWALRNNWISKSDMGGLFKTPKWKDVFIGRMLSSEDDYRTAVNNSGIDVYEM